MNISAWEPGSRVKIARDGVWDGYGYGDHHRQTYKRYLDKGEMGTILRQDAQDETRFYVQMDRDAKTRRESFFWPGELVLLTPLELLAECADE